MFKKLPSKNILIVNMFLLFFIGKIKTFDTLHISKEVFDSILNNFSSNKTMPITGEKWGSEETPKPVDGWPTGSIAKELFDFIRSILPEGKVLLEFGSGWSSNQFSKYYTTYSVEHNSQWLGKYNTHYIYAPIKDRWYDPNILKEKLPHDYDLILVDGPPGYPGSKTNRYDFYKYIDLFKTNVPIIFDDVHRKTEYELMVLVGKELRRDVIIFNCPKKKKKFGVILYEETV